MTSDLYFCVPDMIPEDQCDNKNRICSTTCEFVNYTINSIDSINNLYSLSDSIISVIYCSIYSFCSLSDKQSAEFRSHDVIFRR